MRHWLGNTLRGCCMGLADVIPGVSGGTVALILGIYARLINAVGSVGAGMLRRLGRRSFRSLLKEGLKEPARLDDTPAATDAGHILLLVSVAAGIVPAILAGAKVLPPLLSSHPEQMRGLFLGLVLASVTIPARQIGQRTASRWILACLAALLTAWFAGLPEPVTGGSDPSLAYVFVGGALAVSAMVLPGVSGSFVLLLLGLYHFVLHSLALTLEGDARAALVVATMIAAMAFGMLTFTRVLKALFARWREPTLAVLVGLMVGSLRKLWPFVEQRDGGGEALALPSAADSGTVTVVVMFLVGVGLVFLLDRAGRLAGGGDGATRARS